MIRHTQHGRQLERDPFHRNPVYPPSRTATDTCFLYDADISRLPAYNIEAEPDFDLFEMGRLMGAECLLYDQYMTGRNPDHYAPVTSTSRPASHHYPPPAYHDRDRDRYPSTNIHSFDKHGGYYNRPENRIDQRYPPPASAGSDYPAQSRHPPTASGDKRGGGGFSSSHHGEVENREHQKERPNYGDTKHYREPPPPHYGDADRHRETPHYGDTDRHRETPHYGDTDRHRETPHYGDTDRHRETPHYGDTDRHSSGNRHGNSGITYVPSGGDGTISNLYPAKQINGANHFPFKHDSDREDRFPPPPGKDLHNRYPGHHSSRPSSHDSDRYLPRPLKPSYPQQRLNNKFAAQGHPGIHGNKETYVPPRPSSSNRYPPHPPEQVVSTGSITTVGGRDKFPVPGGSHYPSPSHEPQHTDENPLHPSEDNQFVQGSGHGWKPHPPPSPPHANNFPGRPQNLQKQPGTSDFVDNDIGHSSTASPTDGSSSRPENGPIDSSSTGNKSSHTNGGMSSSTPPYYDERREGCLPLMCVSVESRL